MKSLLIVLLTVAAVTALKQVCTPLSQFKDYCNTCFCTEDGLTFSCTRMMCTHKIWNRDGSSKIALESQEETKLAQKQVCKPRSQFKDYCNICTCAADGLSFGCTLMMCNKEVWNQDGTLKVSEKNTKIAKTDKICEPGKVYSPDGCNTCICDKYGTHSACTFKLCLSTLKQVYKVEETKWGPFYKQGHACTPGKSFYSECNKCVCTGSGKSAFCILMDCSALA